MFKNMTEVVDYDEKGNGINAITAARLKDPDKIQSIESYLFTITNGYTDFSKFENSVKSKAIDKLDKLLKNSTTGGGAPKTIKSSTGKSLMDALDAFGE